jgi:hypothetical protein
MHKFEYEIRLNDLGAPYIYVVEGVKESEHKFMFLEMSRNLIYGIIKSMEKKKNEGKSTLSDNDMEKIVQTFNILSQLSDEASLLYIAQKEINDELDDILGNERIN